MLESLGEYLGEYLREYLAYEHLVTEAALDAAVDEPSVLHSLGVLTGHYCDAPVLFGWELQTTGYRTSIRRGAAFAQRHGMRLSVPVRLNPFRMPLRQGLVNGGSVGFPWVSNGFLAGFNTD